MTQFLAWENKIYVQAAIALFDTDFNVEAACLKILESADNEADDDTWGKVEKPQKKAPNRDDKVSWFLINCVQSNLKIADI